VFRSLLHHLRAIAGLLALTGLVAGFFALARAMDLVASASSSSGLLGALGGGIDEFGVRMAAVEQYAPFTSDMTAWVSTVAVVATAISAVAAFRSLAAWIRGPQDAVAFVRHAAQRAAGTLGTQATSVRWGIVHDAQSGHPLPLARVSVLDGQRRVIARAVADMRGVFGFASTADDVFGRGGVGGLEVRKNGYYRHEALFPVTAGIYAHHFDVPLLRRPSAAVNGPSRWDATVTGLSTVAFWVGILTVPMIYFIQPGAVTDVLVALFGVSVIVRAVGSGVRS
jgi:hypothetical protein